MRVPRAQLDRCNPGGFECSDDGIEIHVFQKVVGYATKLELARGSRWLGGPRDGAAGESRRSRQKRSAMHR